MTPDPSRARRCGLGCRIRSGRAIVALVHVSGGAPQLIDAREIPLADPAIPASTQPFHAALQAHRLVDLPEAERLSAIVRRAADRSATALTTRYERAGHVIRGARLVVGSLIDPATIANQHMRAHALEGQLFRTALEDALRKRGIAARMLLERRAYAEASEALGCSEAEARSTVASMGRGVEGPWRADQKLAALAAWYEVDAME